MHTISRGDGPGVLVLPANGKPAAFYEGLCDALADRGLRATACTFPGFDGTPGPATWEHLLDETLSALPGHEVLVGHSLGGLVALLAAARTPQLRGLVLLEPAVVPWAWAARLLGRRYRRQVIDGRPEAGPKPFTNRGPFFRRLHDPDAYPERAFAIARAADTHTPAAVTRGLQATSDALWPLPLDDVRMPTVLVRGASSGPVMALGQRVLARRLPNARRVVVPEAGHWLVNEQDEVLAAVIAEAASA